MKKFYFTLLCLILCFCTFGFVGCGDSDYSKADIDALYTTMKTSDATKQFFDGNFLKVDFDDEKINLDATDKSYIFPQVYGYYLTSSSNLLSTVVDRVGKISYVVKNFSQDKLNSIYTKLSAVNGSLKNLAEQKFVYERSKGNLHYKNVISSYNSLINNLYSLNKTFANYYFVDSMGKADFSKTNLTDSNVRDMLNYQLLNISKVSFNYELLNFMYTNPLGEVATWYNSTVSLKNYIELSIATLNKLKNANDLASHIGTNSTNILNLFASMQRQEKEFEQEYTNFYQSIKAFNVKEYFSSTNKSAYIENCSNKEQSYFNIINNFLNGRYLAFTDGLTDVLSYM